MNTWEPSETGNQSNDANLLDYFEQRWHDKAADLLDRLDRHGPYSGPGSDILDPPEQLDRVCWHCGDEFTITPPKYGDSCRTCTDIKWWFYWAGRLELEWGI